MKPRCKLIGEDGNIFHLMAVASEVLEHNNLRDKAKEMQSRIFASGSYTEALGIIQEYVDVY